MDTPVVKVEKILLNVWKISQPRLIMSIIGGAKYFTLSDRLETNFINGIIAAIFISILSFNIIRERISNAKNLQLLTGLSKFTYWFSHAVYDFILCLLLCSLLTVVVQVKDLLIYNAISLLKLLL